VPDATYVQTELTKLFRDNCVCNCVCADHCVCTQESFDRARRAHGTDHDTLFVYSESSTVDLNQTVELTAGDVSHDQPL